jgi:predicted MFS family arabinose efflux permease
MGIMLAPLPAAVLAAAGPRNAGAASGILTTAQQVGNALGVAIIGGVFLAALGTGHRAFPHALETSAARLAAVAGAAAAGAQLLPRSDGRPARGLSPACRGTGRAQR